MNEPEGLEEAEGAMRTIAREVDQRLPEGWGFCILVGNFAKPNTENRLNCVSNCDRQVMVEMFRELLERWEG